MTFEYGFTGTSIGMTPVQFEAVFRLFKKLRLNVIHHGDCIGSDAQSHLIGRRVNAFIEVHPPDDPKARAYCQGDIIHPVRPYLKRNRDIVSGGEGGLIATPKDFIKPKSLRGQGTWTTIGYAQQAHRPIWLVFRDGTYRYLAP